MTSPVPVTYYSSADPGAPQIVINNPQTILHVIRQCLVGVNGIAYGEGSNQKPSAGWNLYAEDRKNVKLVIQQGGGQGRYLRLASPQVFTDAFPVSNSANAIYWYALLVNAYNSMTSIDAGTGSFPDQKSWPWNYWGWGGSTYVGNSTGNPNQNSPTAWWIIADKQFFYIKILPLYNYNVNNQTYYFGDLVNGASYDTNNTVLWSYKDPLQWNNSASYNVNQNSTVSVPNQQGPFIGYNTADAAPHPCIQCAGSITGLNRGIMGGLNLSQWYAGLWNAPQGGYNQQAFPITSFNRRLRMVPFELFEQDNPAYQNSHFRGNLPGAYMQDSTMFSAQSQIIPEGIQIKVSGGALNNVPLVTWNNQWTNGYWGNTVLIRTDTWRSE